MNTAENQATENLQVTGKRTGEQMDIDDPNPAKKGRTEGEEEWVEEEKDGERVVADSKGEVKEERLDIIKNTSARLQEQPRRVQ